VELTVHYGRLGEPLWRLTKNGVLWQWTETEQNAFDAIKELTSTQCMGIVVEFRILVDNRAVMLIYSNAKSKPPARIERWALRLTPFDFEIVQRPGMSNMADYYSRSPG
jgi:hypothetical protein